MSLSLRSHDMQTGRISDYGYSNAEHSHTHGYLLGPVLQKLRTLRPGKILSWVVVMGA